MYWTAEVSVIIVALCCLTCPVQSYYVDLRQPADDMIEMIKRNEVNLEDLITVDKRYTQAQDSAIEFCTGECMYNERLPYGECYDLCHWTGQGPSPWVAFYRARETERATKDRDQLLQGSMMRSGSPTRGKSSRRFDQRSSRGGQILQKSARVALQRRKLAQKQARMKVGDDGELSGANRRRLRMLMIPRYVDYD